MASFITRPGEALGSPVGLGIGIERLRMAADFLKSSGGLPERAEFQPGTTRLPPPNNALCAHPLSTGVQMARKKRKAPQGVLHGVKKIVSGGQTGVDRAALDVAIDLGIPHGGWCPLGRLCEKGRIPLQYNLRELPTPDYAARTLKNVIDSDGTLVLYYKRLHGGTALTCRFARERDKPLLCERLDLPKDLSRVVRWLRENRIRVLNVAGPRASSNPEVYSLARAFLLALADLPEMGDSAWDGS